VRRELSWWERYGVSVVLILLAFALRLHRLAEPAMRWDEGWSIAHASLSVPEIIRRIAALEVHPPLFYLILKPWLVLGRSLWPRVSRSAFVYVASLRHATVPSAA